MPIVTGHYTLNRRDLPVKAPDLRIRFALQLVSHKNTLLVLYPNAEPDFEPSYARYVAMMDFRHLLLRGREILVAQGHGQLVVTGQRLIGMITDGFAGKVALSESAGSVFAFALDLDDIRPAQIKEKNGRGEPIEAIIESKVGQSSVFGIKVFDYGEFLLLKDDGQVKRASLSAFLDQLTPESRRNLQVAPTVSEGEQISAHDPTVLNELAMGALHRYRTNGQQVADLNLAVQYWLEALRLPSSDPSDRPAWLNNLAIGLLDRYKLTGDLSDLEAAISASQQAVEATPSDSSDRPMYLNTLGNSLSDRYTRTGNLADLETAIAHFQQAVQATPSDSSDWPMYLGQLGNGLRDRYTRTGNLADLDAAITAWEKSWSMSRSSFVTLPVAYQLGQQRWGVGVVANLVTAYLEQARQYPPRTPSAYRRALEVVEGSKSRLLTQLVGRGPLPLPSGLSRKVAIREQQLLAELTALDTQELTIHDHSVSIQGDISHLQRFQQRQAALHELEDLWTRIAHTGPEGTEYVATRRSATPTWQEFTHLAEDLGTTTGLLSFFTTADQILLFLLRAGWDAPRIVEARLNKADLDKILADLDREILRGTLREETWHQKLLPVLHEIWPHMEGVEQVLLSNAGFGHVLPWAVLIEHARWQTPSGQPMALITLPALSILPGLRRRPPIHISSALVCGNPRGEYANDFSNLSYAETEAMSIAKRFGVQPLLTATATKAAVEKSSVIAFRRTSSLSQLVKVV